MTLLQVIQSLQAAGHSQNAIAAEALCSQGLISQIVTGRVKDVRHSVGQRIFEMHARVMADASADQQRAA